MISQILILNQILMIECLSQGLVFICNGIAVSWKSSRQSVTVVSTTEADYLVALDATKKGVWIR